MDGGMHGGTFRWQGAFGDLTVYGIGWASKPEGRMLSRRTSAGQRPFAVRRDGQDYVAAIWNGRQGAAYFRSPKPLSDEAKAAIDRVSLTQEGEEPTGCKLRTIFVVE